MPINFLGLTCTIFHRRGFCIRKQGGATRKVQKMKKKIKSVRSTKKLQTLTCQQSFFLVLTFCVSLGLSFLYHLDYLERAALGQLHQLSLQDDL